MLAKPNVNEIVGKVGNRYELAIAVAKRARAIVEDRVKSGDDNIKDPVDIAATEIYEGKSIVTVGKIKDDINVPEDVEAMAEEKTDDSKLRGKK